MDLTFTSDEQAFRADCRAWLSLHVPDRLPPLETPDGFEFRRELDRKLFDAGWSVVTWPQPYGGRDASLVEWLIFEEEFHRAGGGLRPVHNGISLLAPALFEYGTDDQRRRYLQPMASATHIWCQGWSEPGAGSDLASLRSHAVRDTGGQGWRLSGHKTWSTRGVFATHLFGLFRTDPNAQRHKGLTYFLVPLDTLGVTVRGFARLGGEQGFSDVFFDEVFVSDDNVLGGVGEGWNVAMSTTGNERGMTLRSPGWFLAAARRLVRTWNERPDQDDIRLADAVASCWCDAQAYRWHTYSLAAKIAAGGHLGPESSMAKIFWSTLDVRIHELAMELIGERALVGSEPWVKGFLNSIASPIWGGTNEIQRNVVAERVLGLPKARDR